MVIVVLLLVLGLAGTAVAQRFTYVDTSGPARFDKIRAVADFNGDGRDDIVVGGRYEETQPGRPEDRFRKWPVRVFFGTRNGRFRPAPRGFVQGNMRARHPFVVAADFNYDGRPDIALYDAGIYVIREVEGNAGMGNPPQLYLSRGRRLYRSAALAAAVRRHNRTHPNPEYSGPADMHLKDLAAGDLDGDGDVDLWVQSMGGANVDPHAMINNGDGTWTLDPNRVPPEVHFNRPHEYWYFGAVHLADIDHDGDLDILQGQAREDGESTRNQFNIVLVNDGTGHFPSRIELPHARFYRGFTAVGSMTTFDMNGDGLLDLLLNHTRNDLRTDAATGVLPFSGRYIQALINRGDHTFGDETNTWIKGQGPTRPQRYPNGDPLHNGGTGMAMRDLNGDGCADLLMVGTWGPIRKQGPLAYRNNGRGQFRPLPPERFWRHDRDLWFGYGAWPADVNGDGLTDIVTPTGMWGPDDLDGTGDDYTLWTTMLNTTRPRPIRCDWQAP